MTEHYQQFASTLGHRVKQQELLSLHSTFKTGGSAELYIEVEKVHELIQVVSLARSLDLPYVILGAGSYIVFPDKGVSGVVIKNNCRKFEMKNVIGKIRNRQLDVEKAYLFAESGVLINQLVRNTIEMGFSGLEYALGLPGTVAGSVMTNAEYAPKGIRILDSVFSARILTEKGEIVEVKRDYFSPNILKRKDVLLSVLFELYTGHKDTLWARGNETVAYRTAFEAYGSTYRPLTVSPTDVLRHHGSLPSIDYLFRHAGLLGKQVGAIAISPANPRFILNTGNGSSEDMEELIHFIQKELKKKYNISISVQMNHFGV